MKQLLSGIALLILVTPYSHAELKDDDDLYDKAGPNSAFIRIVNLDNKSLAASVQDQSLLAADHCAISGTAIVEAGPVDLDGGSWSWQSELQPQQVYTLAVQDGSVISFTQDAIRDPMRAKFEVLNLSAEKRVSVLTSAQGQTVFSDIEPESHEARPLNPLRVELKIATGQSAYVLQPIAFARGRTTSLIICDGDSNLVSTIVTE